MSAARRVALVTGGGRGIGRAIALRLAHEGHDVAITYRAREDVARETASAIAACGVRALPLHWTSGAQGSTRLLVSAVEEWLGAPDVLVNNAALLERVPFETLSETDWRTTIEANLLGPFQLCQALAPAMRARRWGRIVNIASLGGHVGGTLALHYAASKAALVSLTRSLARVLASDGVTCNAVSPGLVETEMIRDELATDAGRAKLAAIPTGRMSTPEEIAALVAFLTHDDAATLTGQTVHVNGGLYLG